MAPADSSPPSAASTPGQPSDDAFTWNELFAEVAQRLGDEKEARLVLEEVSDRKGVDWLRTVNDQAPLSAADKAGDMIRRRLDGEPLQYVLGSWGFRYLHLHVDQRVLIPRPETEQVVEAALQLISRQERPLVADLGTGSGAIALSIASEHPSAHVYATDESADALEVAQYNANTLNEQVHARIRFGSGNWFDALPEELKGRFDLIVSNPPYIGEHEAGDVEDQVADYEPHGALFGGPDGLDDLEHILKSAPAWLKPRGSVVVELAPHQAKAIADLARAVGYDPVAIGQDLSGRDRFIVAAAPGA
jgi:release factor glutamine methyltransferase